jgi:hypothetical protein
MPKQLRDVVRFRDDRLFNGAVNISWFGSDKAKTEAASRAFVFHGPRYHGVQQEDVGTGHGHRLVDTANLARSILRRCYGAEDQPFTLAIAGYGTGKSHFGLTVASLVSAPDGDTAQTVLSAIEAADSGIGSDIRLLLDEAKQPCLAVTLNGMQSFDLSAEITRQVVQVLKADGLDPKPLDDLRPRFGQAASLIRMSNEGVVRELLDVCEVSAVEDVLAGLENQDEQVYAKVHDFFASQGMPIRALSGESVRDVIDITVREYCGRAKSYRCLLVLFDEFGKYTEFATVRSQIAGIGVLQDLFEAIQANAGDACFVGFIQFELNAYVQRVAPEYRNEILRYVTRFQAANRVYLSINLETLIASLLEKRRPELLDRWFDNRQASDESQGVMTSISRWFPQATNHRLWTDPDQFHSVIRKGCWPLSPYATWFLFHLAAAGRHLQERSALALLSDAFDRFGQSEVSDASEWSLSPVDLWTDILEQELISSEEMGQQGSITHAYASVMARHGSRLPSGCQKLLCAVVLASKLGLQVADRDEAIEALGRIAGMWPSEAVEGIKLLQEEYNVLEWDASFGAFDILGDAVPRTQFLSFLRQRVASSYDESGKARLFASKAAGWCDLLTDLECDFAEANQITTREWRYMAVTANLDFLPQQMQIAGDRWTNALGVDDARGTVIYTYVEPSRDPIATAADAKRLLRAVARKTGVPTLPILVVLLCDESGTLGQALAEYAVLEESIGEEDRVRFGNLIGAHQEKLRRMIREQVDSMVKQRLHVTGLGEEIEAQRLSRVGSELFTRIYKSPIPFPFDGFSTAKGNAADTCQELTQELLLGRLDYDGVIARPVKSKNRALTILKTSWSIFTRNGAVSRRPALPVIRSVTEKWDELLASDGRRLSPSDAIRQLCRPPYGANIASAGLLLSVFVSPRSGRLTVVRDGQQLAVSQWVQDGIFRSKFVDLSAIGGVDLVLLGEASSEWETLLDEWEQAENYLARTSCLERALELKGRVPVPPLLVYKEERLREQATAALEALERAEREQNSACTKVERGTAQGDIAQLSWGAAELQGICGKMAAERPLWTDSQIAEVQPLYERARQVVIQLFPEWLTHQAPRTGAPADVGDFKHRMLQLVGGNLKKLDLDEEHRQLEERTLQLVRSAEAAADAHQLVRDVGSWMVAQGDPGRVVRVAEIRELRRVGIEYARKLQGMAERLQSPEIAQARIQLSEFVAKLKDAEGEITKRAAGLWQARIRSEDDIDRTLTEVNALVTSFENLPSDLDDLHLMRHALRLYQRDYQLLSDDTLTWVGFDTLVEEIRQKRTETVGDEDTPWPPQKTIDAFSKGISKRRKERSSAWIGAVEAEAAGAATMSAAEANQLHLRAINPPAVLTEADAKRLDAIARKVTTRLDALSMEWLIERYRELPPKARREFLRRVQQIADEQ